MSHQPPPPPPSSQPMDGKYLVDSFVSYIEKLQALVKKDPKRFEEMCRHMDAEITRFGEVHAKTLRNPQPEDIQETLNLNRRLSITSLLISYLKTSR